MPGPRPKLNNGRVTLYYLSNSGVTHRSNFDCSIANPTGPAPYLLNQVGGFSATWSVLVANVLPLIKAIFAPTTSGFRWELFRYLNGAYISLDTSSPGGVGTSGSPEQIAQESTFFFYDTAHFPDKIVFLETTKVGPDRNLRGGLTAAEAAFVTDVLSSGVANMGSWYQSKDGNPDLTLLARTSSHNRRLRRRLGLG